MSLKQLLPALAGLLLIKSVVAAEPLQFSNAWSPEAPPVAPVMAGYVTIQNSSAQAVNITAASCSEFKHVEIHDMLEQDGMMRMIKQDSLTIPASGQVVLQRGGMHIMLMKPKRVIKAGEQLAVDFTTADGATYRVNFEVRQSVSSDDAHQHHHHH